LKESIIQECSQKYNKTPNQILLRWAVQQGIAVIPSTLKVGSLKENSEIFNWELSPAEM